VTPRSGRALRSFPSRWQAGALLGVLTTALYVGLARTPALVDDDVDAAHALVAREMLERHDYVVLYQDGIRYLIRPPMHFWLIAASYAVFGDSAWSTRLPVALAMGGLVAMTYAFGKRFLGERAGLYGGLAVATSAGMFVFTRTVIPEAIYALEFTAIFFLFLSSWTGRMNPRVGYRAAAAVAALAALTRGPIGVLFPAAAVAVFLTWAGGWRRWRELRLPSSVLIFLAIAAPWHVLAARRAPGFLWAYFINEHVNRVLGTRLPHDYSAVSLPVWLLEHFVWLFPWSAFAPLLGLAFPRRKTADPGPELEARMLLFSWAAVILVFFALENGSRMEYYSFGAWPALALLLGFALARAEERDDRRLVWIARGLAVLGLLYAAASAVFLGATSVRGTPSDITVDLQAHPSNFYQSSMAHVLDLTPQALADLRRPVALSAVFLGVGLVGAWVLRERRRGVSSAVAMALSMMGVFGAANLAYAQLEPSLSSRDLALEMGKSLKPEDRVALYGDIRVAPGIAFYCHRRVLLYNAEGSNLEFGSHYSDAPKTFFVDRDFLPLWAGAQRVLLVVPGDKVSEVLAALPAGSARTLASRGGKTVFSNRDE
jgi:4-amino-4-deoxy-L-arabinose transferase-like glycosyltransferase